VSLGVGDRFIAGRYDVWFPSLPSQVMGD